MTPFLAPLTLILAAQADAPPPAPAPQAAQEAEVAAAVLTPAQASSLRCGVGFAIIHRLQAEGGAEGKKYPALGDRGREFFVRTATKIMDETGADRAAFGKLVADELAGLVAQEEQLPAMMPGCLAMLDASGL